MSVDVRSALADIPAREWNEIAGAAVPFLRHDFLLAAEKTHCVAPVTGWQPCHLVLYDGGKLRAAMPLYEKTHSWGEFVFDWAWADAYRRAGLDYYPKLVSAVPFTPASSPRLLRRDPGDRDAASKLLNAAIELAGDRGCSSVHLLFPDSAELDDLTAAGFKLRKDCQFHWTNRGYRDFDEFLQGFSARKRKKARRDRRHVAEAGVTFKRLAGNDITAAELEEVFRLISLTFMRRGSLPYFDLEFFESIVRSQPESFLAIVALRDQNMIAAAVFFVGRHALYGRYWGSEEAINALHFETCYFQGIEYAIDHRIARFEPGTQGEHKVSRGFEPHTTWSAHWLAQPEFFDAIGSYLDEEGRHVERYIDAIDARTPFKTTQKPEPDEQ